jgi:hypothetical protein
LKSNVRFALAVPLLHGAGRQIGYGRLSKRSLVARPRGGTRLEGDSLSDVRSMGLLICKNLLADPRGSPVARVKVTTTCVITTFDSCVIARRVARKAANEPAAYDDGAFIMALGFRPWGRRPQLADIKVDYVSTKGDDLNGL